MLSNLSARTGITVNPWRYIRLSMSDKRKRIVIKFGTGMLTRRTGASLHHGQFRRLTSEVAELVREGHQCLLVSSGAVGAGLMLLKMQVRPTDLPSVQACAAVGQSRLMHLYESLFQRHGFHVAQLLLSHQDIDSRSRYQNARNTLERLLRFRDNDRLSAEVAILAKADLLIILTSVNGLLDEKKRLIETVADIDSVSHLANGETGTYSTGGMITKLQAVKIAVQSGIPGYIASGLKPGMLRAIVTGQPAGTHFPT